MTEQEARAEARRRNLRLGATGPTDYFFLEVEREPGVWEVERTGTRRQAVPSGAFGKPSGTRD